MEAYYRILHIYEDDFGCEERPEDQAKQVLVVLRDSCGMEQTIRQDDDRMYALHLEEGDTVRWENGLLWKTGEENDHDCERIAEKGDAVPAG